MCFVKAYGVIFSGAPRSRQAAEATEVPAAMVIGMVALALACVVLGLAAPGGAGARRRLGADPEPAGDRLRRRRDAGVGETALDADGHAAPDRARHAAGAARVALRDRPPRAICVSERPGPAAICRTATWRSAPIRFAQPIRMFFAGRSTRSARPWRRSRRWVDRRFDGFVAAARLQIRLRRHLVAPVTRGVGESTPRATRSSRRRFPHLLPLHRRRADPLLLLVTLR